MITITSLTAPLDLTRLERLANTLDFSNDYNYLQQCLQNKNEQRSVLVATIDHTDVGLCVVNFAPLYPMFRRLDIPEIQDLNVSKDARGQGVGTALVAAAEDVARSRGATDIGIGVGLTADYGPAQRLYVKLGYVPNGTGITVAGDTPPIRNGDIRAIDDDVCLYMVKNLSGK